MNGLRGQDSFSQTFYIPICCPSWNGFGCNRPMREVVSCWHHHWSPQNATLLLLLLMLLLLQQSDTIMQESMTICVYVERCWQLSFTSTPPSLPNQRSITQKIDYLVSYVFKSSLTAHIVINLSNFVTQLSPFIKIVVWLFVYFDLFGCDHTMTLSNREPSMLHF